MMEFVRYCKRYVITYIALNIAKERLIVKSNHEVDTGLRSVAVNRSRIPRRVLG